MAGGQDEAKVAEGQHGQMVVRGQDHGRKQQKAEEFVVQKRRQSYSSIAAKRKVGEVKPDEVETRNRFDVLTEEDQAGNETINSQTVLT